MTINEQQNSQIMSAKENGIGLPAAIFVMTVMAAIAAAVSYLVTQNAQTFGEEVNLTRSFYAAESGAGFAMNTVFPPEEYSAYATTAECAAGPRVYNFISEGLNQCSASVTCNRVIISGTSYATIESTGSCGDVERTVQVRTVY